MPPLPLRHPVFTASFILLVLLAFAVKPSFAENAKQTIITFLDDGSAHIVSTVNITPNGPLKSYSFNISANCLPGNFTAHDLDLNISLPVEVTEYDDAINCKINFDRYKYSLFSFRTEYDLNNALAAPSSNLYRFDYGWKDERSDLNQSYVIILPDMFDYAGYDKDLTAPASVETINNTTTVKFSSVTPKGDTMKFSIFLKPRSANAEGVDNATTDTPGTIMGSGISLLMIASVPLALTAFAYLYARRHLK